MSHHYVSVKDLIFEYPDGRRALDGISFYIKHGESVGIVGANGAGKSTLLMHLVGILFPKSGDVVIGDTPVDKKTLPHIRERVGLVFQDPDDQLFMTRVYDDVAFGPRNYGLPEVEVEKRVNAALETVGISNLSDRAPYHLSGGEKRAAAIASILAMEPDVLIMDEPTSALDPRARRRLINMLKGFSHTKIIASHDMDMVMDICSRTIVLKQGKVMADAPTLEIFQNGTLLEECYLEAPLSLLGCPICGKNS